MQFLSFLGYGLYNIVKLATLTVGGATFIAITTKPNEASFDEYFKTYASKKFDQELSKEKNNNYVNNVGINIAKKVASSVASRTSSKQFDDYIVFKHAKVTLPEGESSTELHFIGCFNGWHQSDPHFIEHFK